MRARKAGPRTACSMSPPHTTLYPFDTWSSALPPLHIRGRSRIHYHRARNLCCGVGDTIRIDGSSALTAGDGAVKKRRRLPGKRTSNWGIGAVGDAEPGDTHHKLGDSLLKRTAWSSCRARSCGVAGNIAEVDCGPGPSCPR